MPEEIDLELKEQALRLAKLNPQFVRDIITSHWIRFEELEFSEGKQTKGKATKHYKEEK